MFKKHVIMWILGTVILLAVSIWFGDRVITDQFIKERAQVEKTMGKDSAERVRKRANMVYGFCCNWAASFSYEMFVPPTEDTYGVQKGAQATHQAFWTSVYMVIMRIFIVSEWLVIFAVIFVASVNQGFSKRAISVTNTAWSSSVRYHLGLHYLVGVFGLLINYILWPWTIHPYIAVFLLSLMCYVGYIISSNVQPKI